ncbi:ABC transporter family protein, partial [Vibrio parahaemolyticus V-223/04]
MEYATALDNVALPLVYSGIKAKERRQRAAKLLEQVGLGDRLNHKPNQLSGGQKQRV